MICSGPTASKTRRQGFNPGSSFSEKATLVQEEERGSVQASPRGDIFMNLHMHPLVILLKPWRQWTQVDCLFPVPSTHPSAGPGTGQGVSVTLVNECVRSIWSQPCSH